MKLGLPSDRLFLSYVPREKTIGNDNHKKERQPQTESRSYFPKIASETARVFSEKNSTTDTVFARSKYNGNNERNSFSVKIRNTTTARRELRVEHRNGSLFYLRDLRETLNRLILLARPEARTIETSFTATRSGNGRSPIGLYLRETG